MSTFAYLHSRLHAPAPDHERFVGTRADLGDLNALELGTLWPELQRARRERDNPAAAALADDILAQAQARQLQPAFDADSCVRTFAQLNEHDFERAIDCLARLTCPAPAALAPHLLRVLGDSAEWPRYPWHAAALARLLDQKTRARVDAALRPHYADTPYRLQEWELLPDLSFGSLLALAGASLRWYWPAQDGVTEDGAARALAAEPAYLTFAERAVSAATAHVRAIQSGAVPYQADGAFARDDSPVLARAVRVGALLDAPWLRPLFLPLLTGVCVAPTAAKTAPSQSLAVALGHSIEGIPTPEGVEALRAALGVVRHAGLVKKLERKLKPAERALAARPELALRLAGGGAGGKAREAMLGRCIEAGFWQGLRLGWADWCAQLAASAAGARFARELVWRVGLGGEPVSFMLDPASRDPVPLTLDGAALAPAADAQVTLWHPAAATPSEREQWRARIKARQLRQPIRQVYREHYTLAEQSPGSSAQFAGHVLAGRALLGLAGREGWRINDGMLVREFGAVRALFEAGGRLYPGMDCWVESGRLWFELRRESRWEAAAAAQMDAVALSEALRAVDLLVSSSAFAERTDHSDERWRRLSRLEQLPLGEMLRMRRSVLADVFADALARGRIDIGARHIVVGEHAVHLTTGRVTRQGEEAEIALPAVSGKIKALPWLPYDEVLLEKTARAVALLLENGQA